MKIFLSKKKKEKAMPMDLKDFHTMLKGENSKMQNSMYMTSFLKNNNQKIHMGMCAYI